jgi:hypothetical protein
MASPGVHLCEMNIVTLAETKHEHVCALQCNFHRAVHLIYIELDVDSIS